MRLPTRKSPGLSVDQSHRILSCWKTCGALCSTVIDNEQHPLRVHIDADALTQLPHDGNLLNISPMAVETPATSDQQISKDTSYNAHPARPFVPVATRSMTEQEAV